MEVSSRRLAIVQHCHLPALGLLSLFSLLSAFLLTGIKRNQARSSDSAHAAPVASRSAHVRAPARGARAPRRPAGGAKERRARGATDGTGEEQEKKRPPRRARTALLDCGGENHPRRRTRAARVARLSPVAPRALAPRGAAAVEKARDEDEDDDRRPDGRRAREEDHRGARERPCSTAAARTTHGDARAPRASRARHPSPPARRALAPHGAAAVEKARDEDDDRRPDGRRAREEDHRGAREWPCSIAAARTTHGARRARVPRRDASTPLACSARSGDRRDDARQGRRPATRMTAARHVPAEVRRREPPKRGVFAGARA